MREFDLNLLEPLDALLQSVSVTAAARACGVSQSTMSGMLARLRLQFGDPLLVRIGRNMELTPRAVELRSEIRQTLLRVERLIVPQVDFAPAALRQHFRIMASEFGLFLILPQVFRQAQIGAPGATFEAVLIDRPAESVYGGVVDCCLTGDILGGVSGDMAAVVRTQKLMEDDFVGLVDADHPLVGRVTLDQLLSYPHVATQFPGSPWTVEDIGLSGLSDRHPPRVRVASFLAIGHMVAGSEAIGVVPRQITTLVPEHSGLRKIELPADFSRIAIRLLWHDRDHQDPAHRWLRTLIADACAVLSSQTLRPV